MKALHRFHRAKFMTLDEEQRHKKCAELLRSVIESDQTTCQAICQLRLAHYGELCEWMAFAPLPQELQKSKIAACELEALADRYHAHMELAAQRLKEDRLLHFHESSGLHLNHDDGAHEVDRLDVTLFLQGLRTAHNIGNIIRSAECFGLGCVVLSPNMVGVASAQVKRAAMGCEKWVQVFEGMSLEDCPRPWIALETSPEAKPLYEFCFPSSFTLVLGNEEYGIAKATLNACDECLHIPLHGKKNSLNVASALAVAAYEIRRQRASSVR